jgi:uncharacterized protein (UPF0212 family)
MPLVGFELTIPVFQLAKTLHALDRAATVIGKSLGLYSINVHVPVSEIILK